MNAESVGKGQYFGGILISFCSSFVVQVVLTNYISFPAKTKKKACITAPPEDAIRWFQRPALWLI